MTSQKFWLLQTAVQICMVKCHVQAAWTKYALQIQTVLCFDLGACCNSPTHVTVKSV